jgi:hypothetical protein
MNVPQDPINPHVVVYSFDAPFAEYFNSYQRGGLQPIRSASVA